MNPIVTALVSGGGGALLGAVITSIATYSLNRATAVKLISEAAKGVGEDNESMRKEIRLLRSAIINLTDAVDKVVPLLDPADASAVRRELLKANTAAKLAV